MPKPKVQQATLQLPRSLEGHRRRLVLDLLIKRGHYAPSDAGWLCNREPARALAEARALVNGLEGILAPEIIHSFHRGLEEHDA